MKLRKIKKNILIVLLIFPLIITGCSTPKNQPAEFKTISGTLVFRDPALPKKGVGSRGLVFLDAATSEITPIGCGGFEGKFMGDGPIIIYDTAGGIALYNTITKEKTEVYKQKGATELFNFEYVKDDIISIGSSEGKIFLLNTKDGTKKTVVSDVGNPVHSWSGDGITLYYSDNDNKIHRYNTETNKNDILVDGVRPKVSKDNKYIAYTIIKTETMIVKDLNSFKEWKYDGAAKNYCFSPDGEYIAIDEEWRGPWYSENELMNIWDFKANKAHTVVSNYLNSQCVSIDWR